MKKNKFLAQFKQGTKVVIATTIMGIALVSASGISNVNYSISAQYVKITAKPAAVAPTPATISKTLYGVTTASISIRTGAHINYSVQGTFANGTKINITGVAGSFYRVNYNGKTGYISNQYVKLVAVAAPTPATVSKTLYGVTTASISIRTGAHVNYSIQGTFASGTKINITGVAGSFYRVNYNGKTGYISNQYVKLAAVAEPTPVTVSKTLYGVTIASISIRTGAHVNYSIQGTFASGTKINITGVAGSFYRVSYNGKTGYISNQYVKLVATAVDVEMPVAVPPVVNASTTSKISTTTCSYNYPLDLLIDIQFGLKDSLTDMTGKWLLADKTQIKYYVDPLNAQTTEQKYQFLKLSYTDGISSSEINSVVQSKGVLAQQGATILDSCKTNNVNPAYLISHAILETGNGDSDLSNGIIVTQVNGKPVIPKVVYNLFGIGAFDSNPLKLGSEYAYTNGWFTVEQAIAGGANWISKYYINNATNKQNTLYEMRWNPYTAGTHQYATDIGWASKQTKNIKAIMDKFTNANLYFEIPQYTLK